MMDPRNLDRRGFAKLMGLAGSSRRRRCEPERRPRRRQQPHWKDWVAKFYGKPIKMAVSCAGTTNPYFAPTKAGAEDAGAQLGIDMLWTGVPDGNTVNQIAQFQQLVNTGYEAIVVISFEPDAWIAPIKKAMAAGVLVVTSNNDTPNSGRELYFGQDLVGAAVRAGADARQARRRQGQGRDDQLRARLARARPAHPGRAAGRQGRRARGCRRLQHQSGRHGERARDDAGHPARSSRSRGDDAALRTRHGGRRTGAQEPRATSSRSSGPTFSTRRSN